MPQLTDRFGPIPSSVVLNGSGNGQLTFQANGSNARITNLYVNVAPLAPATSVVLQATCTIYKGQVAPSNIIDSTNSGSTGASAKGAIDLTDGETLYVVWSGGDAGASAFATFTGVTVPFDQIGASSIEWANPIAAGDGSLIYPQIKSPDYVAGVSGWAIFRNGSVEFNNATIRGSVSAGGGTVVLDSNGIRVADISGNVEYLVNRSGGFAARNVPNNGGISQLTVGQLTMIPGDGDPTPGGNTVTTRGRVSVNYDTVGAEETFSLDLVSGSLNSQTDANIKLRSEGDAGTAQPYILLDANGGTGSAVEMNAETVAIAHKMRNGYSSMFYCPMQLNTASFAVTAANSVNFVLSFPVAFPVGSTVWVFTNLTSSAGPSSGFYSRAFGISPTGCTINVHGPGAVVGTFTADVDWAAFVIPV